MSVIATLLPDPLYDQRLHAAARDRHELLPCADWATLTQVCYREPVEVAVIDLYADECPGAQAIAELRRRLPRLTLIAYVAATPHRTHHLFDAARAGLDGLVLVGEDDAPRPLLTAIERAELNGLGGLIRRSLEGFEPIVVDALLMATVRARDHLSPDALARLLAHSRRGMTRRLLSEGFPPPQRLLTWGRLIVAAHLLEQRHRTADSVAVMLHFPSGPAFRNSCQRYLRATPSQIRSRGGAAYAIRAMLRQVRGRVATDQEPHRRSPVRVPALAV
ncbi:MAG TPA: helix-turn-helix domain-containing protein [Gemmatimonadaceae bacterium]